MRDAVAIPRIFIKLGKKEEERESGMISLGAAVTNLCCNSYFTHKIKTSNFITPHTNNLVVVPLLLRKKKQQLNNNSSNLVIAVGNKETPTARARARGRGGALVLLTMVMAMMLWGRTAVNAATIEDSMDTMSNVPQTLSGDDCKKSRIQRPKSRDAERCTVKCVTTCIRGGAGSPGEGPLNARRPLVVFKEGFHSRRYCLVECSDICNLIKDGEDGP